MFLPMKVCAWGPPSRFPLFDDDLTWRRVQVEGRPASFGVGGADGPPVVFLHGWALGSRAYKRAITRLTARGCQVYAPALPSFGGTADLPSADRNLDGYATWVADFMSAVEIDEPALVIGHSFGGGVAIKLAHRQPQLVRYLVLLNAVGGVAPRPPWEWLGGFAREFWPLPQAWEMAQAVGADVLPNLVRNPLGLLRVARLAQLADLRSESADLRASRVPVLVLTSEGDGVIPRTAFETLCDAVGTNGRVVSGRPLGFSPIPIRSVRQWQPSSTCKSPCTTLHGPRRERRRWPACSSRPIFPVGRRGRWWTRRPRCGS